MGSVLYTNAAQTKLLVHNADTNDQEVGVLMKECCCGDQYVRLVQCYGTFTCGNCPSSQPSGDCDEDGDGSADYQGVKYILADDWTTGAKSFSWESGNVPCDGTNGSASWSSVPTSGAVVATSCGTAYLTSGLTSASDQARIKACNVIGVSDLMTFQHLPPATPPVYDDGIDDGFFDILAWSNCSDHCNDYFNLFKGCQVNGSDGLPCGVNSNDNCPDIAKDYYVLCTAVETALGSGQFNNNLGKVFELTRSGVSNLCAVGGNQSGQSLVCGADIEYGCTTVDNSGFWAKGYKDGENLIYTSVTGNIYTDCCNCVSGANCSCAEWCQGDSSFSVSFSGAGTNGSNFQCCDSDSTYYRDCAADTGGPRSAGCQPPGSYLTSGDRNRDGSQACSKAGTCPTLSGSVLVTKPFDPLIPFPDCYAPYYSSNANTSTFNEAVNTDKCFEDGTGCQKLVSIGKQETNVFRCVNCSDGDPCNCAGCTQSGTCQNSPQCPCQSMTAVQGAGSLSATAPDCMDVDVDSGTVSGTGQQLYFWLPSCQDPDGYEDDWFISLVAIYCSATADPDAGTITKWRVKMNCSWPAANNVGGHGCRAVDKQNQGFDNPGDSSTSGLTLTFEKDAASDSPAGVYSIVSVDGLNIVSPLAIAGADCIFPAGSTPGNEGGLSSSIFANMKATVS